jgi:hypothetical protein
LKFQFIKGDHSREHLYGCSVLSLSISCCQNQSGPGLYKSRELIFIFHFICWHCADLFCFFLLDTPSPPLFHPTPTWFSTGRALDLCSGLTRYTAYNVQVGLGTWPQRLRRSAVPCTTTRVPYLSDAVLAVRSRRRGGNLVDIRTSCIRL